MLTENPPQEALERLAYCPDCRGVLPFAEVRVPIRSRVRLAGSISLTGASGRTGLRCGRCATVFLRVDPGPALRARALRYLIYASACGAMLAMMGFAVAALAGTGPFAEGGIAGAGWLMGALLVACLARAWSLHCEATRYESLEPFELVELGRRLCPGMIRSDVFDVLSRSGWRPGKIRTVVSTLRPASRASS
ncbi:MAG TPA: hypothetical protein VFP98_01565 [Candidatus Polarisedimenticolia bacterium]|nr:hypothetical protein [Candidatus Polarisedimenticolia bacterium]